MPKILNLFKSTNKIFKRDRIRKIRSSNDKFKLLHNDEEINIRVRKIKQFSQKLNGLLFKNAILSEQWFCIYGSKAFNSFGIFQPVDVIFCDIKRRVFEIYRNFPPNKFSKYHKETYSIYVLAGNGANIYKIEKDDILSTRTI
ncbi:hypothetical protein [Spiroplasma endosymbiont of Aspidapion aeneum]|uniref:hypothetical protein n=1 Tax=Spiroplasma endosymbiont of Aspidapion aeneum TaxID=3066276 RepID=UPI00313EF1E5